jgi:hypothetical protein
MHKKDTIQEEIVNEIRGCVSELLVQSLQGIRKEQSFDLNCVNYTVDNLEYRVSVLSGMLAHLAVKKAIELLTPRIEQDVIQRIKATF